MDLDDDIWSTAAVTEIELIVEKRNSSSKISLHPNLRAQARCDEKWGLRNLTERPTTEFYLVADAPGNLAVASFITPSRFR